MSGRSHTRPDLRDHCKPTMTRRKHAGQGSHRTCARDNLTVRSHTVTLACRQHTRPQHRGLFTMGHNLSDVIADYLKSCGTGGGCQPSTVRNKRRTLDHLLTAVGNIQTRNVNPLHVDRFFAAMASRGHCPAVMNNHLFTLRHFFRWAGQRGYRTLGDDPSAGRRPMKLPQKDRLLVPASDFGRLLDACEHPRDRIVVALGLYLFLRQSEIAVLRISDIDLKHSMAHVTVQKTREFDEMPISRELDVELRRWLTWYAKDSGPLQPSWYLTPAKIGAKFTGVGRGVLVRTDRKVLQLRPTTKQQKIEKCATRALELAGYPIRDDTGKPTMEGIHTLRRSGARALFDDRIGVASYEGIGRAIQAMLHHKSFAMTERYLGISLDKKRRNELLAGKLMFREPDMTNVVELRREGVNS